MSHHNELNTKLMPFSLHRLWVWLCVSSMLCAITPLRYTYLKVGFLAGTVAACALAAYLFRFKRWVCVVCSVIAGIIGSTIIFLMLPGRDYDSSELRRDYVASLLSYRGTPYVWGGGNYLGLDCSGLVQSAFIEALFERALVTGNPALARAGFSLWWNNRSARALGEGYRDETVFLRQIPSLNIADYSGLLPGDLAVMSDGVHVLAYIGSFTWIESDPIAARVRLARVPNSEDVYLCEPVRMMRWRTLSAD